MFVRWQLVHSARAASAVATGLTRAGLTGEQLLLLGAPHLTTAKPAGVEMGPRGSA